MGVKHKVRVEVVCSTTLEVEGWEWTAQERRRRGIQDRGRGIEKANQRAVFKEIVDGGFVMILAFFLILVVLPIIGVFILKKLFKKKYH